MANSTARERVSVVICTYNGASFIAQQIDSVLAQTYMPAEIIVQDDLSDDGTWEIIEQYAQRYQIVKACRNEGERGINANFLSAMHSAASELIAVCDQDDIWETDKLERQVRAIGGNLLCAGFSRPFSTDGYPVSFDQRIPNTHLCRVIFLTAMHGHTLLLRKELLTYLPRQCTQEFMYDWRLQLVATAAESVVFLPHVLVNFRRHAGASTVGRPFSKREYFQTIVLHAPALRRIVRQRFQRVQPLLRQLPFQTESLRLAIELTDLLVGAGIVNYCRLTCFCLRHHTLLFHASNGGSWWRALVYPITCGYPFRRFLHTGYPVS